jgi:hypothetical protein
VTHHVLTVIQLVISFTFDLPVLRSEHPLDRRPVVDNHCTTATIIHVRDASVNETSRTKQANGCFERFASVQQF